MACGRIWWVDNVNGSDTNTGTSYDSAFLTLNQGFGVASYHGGPGDTVRICYTGTDYTPNISRSTIGDGDNWRVSGCGWGEGEFSTIEGYDPDGGNKRPKLLISGGSSASYAIVFTNHSNYWLVKDLWFEYDGTNIGWSTGAISIANTIDDNRTYFKVRSCIFDGLLTNNTTQHSAGIYVIGGGRTHVDVQYNWFKDCAYSIRGNTTVPRMVGYRIKHNLITGADRIGTHTWYVIDTTSSEETIDYTYTNNTVLCYGASQYTGAASQLGNGAYITDGRDNFEVLNNFVFWTNYFLRGISGSGATPEITKTVQYNTWGKLNGASLGYSGIFDVCETNGYLADHDISLDGLKNWAAVEELFGDVDATNFFWPETGWMTVLDLRPKAVAYLGAPHGDVEARGAIQLWSRLNQVIIATDHQAIIASDTQAAWNTDTLLSQEFSTGRSFTFLSNYTDSSAVITTWGDQTSYDHSTTSITTLGTKVGFWAYPYVTLDPGHEIVPVWATTEGWLYGPSTDITSTPISATKGEYRFQWNIGATPPAGVYYMRFRAKDVVTDVWTSWQIIADFVRP